MSGLPLRSELPKELTWDLTLLFKDQAAFEAALTEVKAKVTEFKETFQGLIKKAKDVEAGLITYNEIAILKDHLVNYGELAYSVELNNEMAEKNLMAVDQLKEWINQNIAFFKAEVLALETSVLDAVKANEEMTLFLPFLEELEREKPTLFDAETEGILGALSGTLFGQEKLYNSWKFEDLTFEDFTVDGETFHNSFAGFEQDLEVHPNREVRHKAWKSFHDGLARYQNVAAGNYITLVKTHKKMATLRGFDSVFDYLLFSQNVSTKDYNNVIDTLMSEWAPVMRRYASMLKEEQGLDEISLADIKISFSKDPAQKISVEESRQMVQMALSPLGDEYSEIIERAFEERWIDYPMNQGKLTGGFCASPYRKPNYILLNWTGLLNEVLVLAHELGHAGNFALASQAQSQLSVDPSLYFVEAPSTCNEVITCQYLLNQPLEDSAKRNLLAGFVTSTYYHNMVTHLLEATYQRKVYQAVDKGEVLNARVLNQFFKESLEEFWGDALTINEGAELTWMRQPHYFDGLYSYTYSAGLSIGTQMGQRIAAGDQEAIDQWIAVLRQGGAKGPLELAKMANVDMSTPEPLRQAITYVSELLDQIDALK